MLWCAFLAKEGITFSMKAEFETATRTVFAYSFPLLTWFKLLTTSFTDYLIHISLKIKPAFGGLKENG